MAKKVIKVSFIALVIIAIFAFVAAPTWIIAGVPRQNDIVLDPKADDPCTGNETAGRCADKPLPTQIDASQTASVYNQGQQTPQFVGK